LTGGNRSLPSVSVVIPAHAAVATLPACLAAFRVPGNAAEEVIVVDDGSPDATAKVAEAHGARVLRLDRNGGPSRARNAGAGLATGSVLFFVDADVVLMPGAVDRVRRGLKERPELAALFGSYDDRPAAPGLVSRFRNLLHHFMHQRGSEQAATFWAACGAVRRELFLEVGGFDCAGHPRCIEDIELGYRIRAKGWLIGLDKGLQCTHLKRWSLAGMIRTDLFCRAVPWARLNLERRTHPADLNLRPSQAASVAGVWAALCCLLLGLLAWPLLWAASGLLLAVALANLGLLRFLAGKGGLPFAAGCLLLLDLYFIYCGAGWLYVRLAFACGVEPRDWNHG